MRRGRAQVESGALEQLVRRHRACGAQHVEEGLARAGLAMAGWYPTPGCARVVPQKPQAPAQAAPATQCEAKCAHHRPLRLSWERLLKRVFDFDLERRPN